MHYSLPLFFICILYSVNCHEEEVHTVKYNVENFGQEISKKNHFVMFYAPWCGHCQKFAPKWEQLAEMLNDDEDNNIKIAKVDCTTDSDICSEQEITGYPTLKFYKVGETQGIKFRGTRDLPSITNFINEQLSEGEEETGDIKILQSLGGLSELTSDNFDKHTSSGKHFIKFYAPWCGHCQKLAPTWEQLAKTLEFQKEVSIGKVDCTQYRTICNTFDVKGYPTLLWIEDGKKVDKFQGERSHDSLKEYVNKMLGTKKGDSQEQDQKVTTEEVLGELTGDNFKTGIQTGITFVKFFAPWCGHCKRLAATWESLREKLSARNDINIVKVDCTLDVNKNLCNDEDVEGFPSLFLYKDGEKFSVYSGSRSLDDLYDYVMKHTSHDEL